ncbi:hypothetical protein [Schlesneria paludicola]|uniref:hypothetical protein n=1 Tax=Schlesneria paludicola TaxID=360056 RepID=UPI00029AFDD3|nr:hypothetical protein [Schlesneria paludicola]
MDNSRDRRRTLRLILYVFLLTFVTSRMVVFLIMDRLMPDLYLHVKGTHVHHLNYGIFLLSGVGAYILVMKPVGLIHDLCTIGYAIGLGLTFDEFGMWLHLGGPYWQRASFDAVVTISALLAFLAFSPPLREWTTRRWIRLAILGAVLGLFSVLFANSLKHAKEILTEKLQTIEAQSPQ